MIGLGQNEKILHTARAHWFIFCTQIIFIVLLGLAPPALYLFFPHILLPYLEKAVVVEGSGTALFFFFYALWGLLLWMIFAVFWTDYYLDVWYVTNERVIDIDQRGLFDRKVSSFRLDMIQDVTVEVPGLLATMIDFGTIRVETAGQDNPFKFRGVAHPNLLKERIMAEHRRAHEQRREVTIKEAAKNSE